jgi:hypothetical protein
MRSDNVLRFGSPQTGRDRAPVRSAPRSILSVGNDAELLHLRQQLISSQSSLSVRSLSPIEAGPWSGRKEPYLWVFCYTVSLADLVYLACRVLRFSPESRLILLEGSQRIGFEASLFHLVLRPTDGVREFLEAVTHLSVAA